MINSKQIKEDYFKWTDPDDLAPIPRMWYYIKEYTYHKFVRFYKVYTEKLSRTYRHARFGWHNYDYDMSYAYRAFHFKLKRLYNALENGHAVQEEETMRALKELTKIVQRLALKNYENKYFRYHDKKWGKLESKTIPIYEENGKIKWHKWECWRETTKDASEKIKEQEKKELFLCYEKGEEDRCKDIDRMAEILKKHALKFWD